MQIYIVIFFILGIAILLPLSIHWDERRIRYDIAARGGQFLEKHWDAWSPGEDRTYHVRFKDIDGNERTATCRTSLLSGVFWADMEVFRSPRDTSTIIALKNENQRLQKELEQTRKEQP